MPGDQRVFVNGAFLPSRTDKLKYERRFEGGLSE